MANFNLAFLLIKHSEGGYANDPTDRGGETYVGISRKFWPQWPGWNTIEQCKLKKGFPLNLRDDVELSNLVKKFYKENFWDKIKGDFLSSQKIANLLLDAAVNEGIVPAVKRAQLLCGLPQTGSVDSILLNKLNNLS